MFGISDMLGITHLVLCQFSVTFRVTPRLKIFRVRTDGVQGNQVHGFIVQSLEVLNLDFQPIPSRSKFYSIAT